MIRKPVSKEAQDKKRKIMEKGFLLMCEKGYHNVTCIDIAKYANVSTGIIYQYFNDKRDIFIEGVKNYASNIMFPVLNILDTSINKDNLYELLNLCIDKFIEVHLISKKAHEEIMAMSCLDEEVADIFHKEEISATEKIVKYLELNGYKIDNIDERVHLIYGMIDNYCHEVIYHKHKRLNYDTMKSILIDTIINILK